MRCPGQDSRYWKEDAIFEIECPYCGTTVEFFKDDTTRKCPNCKKMLVNPKMDFGCAIYCQYANVCLGEIPKKILQERAHLLKERIAFEVEKRIPKNLFQQIIRLVKLLESSANEKVSSPGLSLLFFYFYYLTTKERKEVAEKICLPESVYNEIELKLKELKEGLLPDELLKILSK